jgi:hypothetical protein
MHRTVGAALDFSHKPVVKGQGALPQAGMHRTVGAELDFSHKPVVKGQGALPQAGMYRTVGAALDFSHKPVVKGQGALPQAGMHRTVGAALDFSHKPVVKGQGALPQAGMHRTVGAEQEEFRVKYTNTQRSVPPEWGAGCVRDFQLQGSAAFQTGATRRVGTSPKMCGLKDRRKDRCLCECLVTRTMPPRDFLSTFHLISGNIPLISTNLIDISF